MITAEVSLISVTVGVLGTSGVISGGVVPLARTLLFTVLSPITFSACIVTL